MRLVLRLVLAATLAACGRSTAVIYETGDAGAPDSGTGADSGTPSDGGGPRDGGSPTDAGTSSDGGTEHDAGPPDSGLAADAGTSSDGGGAQDAGTPDAGSPDSGPRTTPFTFLVYGDSRAASDCSPNAVHRNVMARMAQEQDVALTFHVGDMIVGGTNDRTCFASSGGCSGGTTDGNFGAIVAPLNNRSPRAGLPASFFPVIGNHEDGSSPDVCGTSICDVFDLSAIVDHSTPNNDPCGADYADSIYYRVRYGDTVFLVLRINDDGYDLVADTAQHGWLQSELAAADADSTVRHKIVLLHAVVYTSVGVANGGHDAVACAQTLWELFDQHGVELVFSGHNHNYERTVPIRAGAQASGGTVYLTTGGGGAPEDLPSGAWFTAAKSQTAHYIRIVNDGQKLSAQAIDVDGTEFDRF